MPDKKAEKLSKKQLTFSNGTLPLNRRICRFKLTYGRGYKHRKTVLNRLFCHCGAGVRGHLCEAEAPTEPAGETAARCAAIRSSAFVIAKPRERLWQPVFLSLWKYGFFSRYALRMTSGLVKRNTKACGNCFSDFWVSVCRSPAAYRPWLPPIPPDLPWWWKQSLL